MIINLLKGANGNQPFDTMNTECSVTSKTRSLAKIRIFKEKRKLISAVTIVQCEICSNEIFIS